MTYQGEDITLTNCDREPIHQIGAIQDFGCLLVFGSDWLLAHQSTNVAEICRLSEAPEIGQQAKSLFSMSGWKKLRAAASQLDMTDDVERVFGIDLFGDNTLFDVALHVSHDLTLIEIERHEEGALDRGLAMVRPLISKLEKYSERSAMFNSAVSHLRDILGYDRVMLYRFGEDQSGEVVAERTADGLPPYLGLRYPATDIPRQARALYLRNRFRIIVDTSSEQIPIVPGNTVDGEPLDLSMSTLRAHSQIHNEYLQNMGVGASLSIAIIIQGKLWGLFACHHSERRVLSNSLRAIAELFSELFSLALERTLADETRVLEQRGRALHDRIARSFTGGNSLAASLPSLAPIIDGVIKIDGITLYCEEGHFTSGSTPTEAEFMELLPMLNSVSTGRVFTSEALTEQAPIAASFADRAVGALVLPISRRPRDYMVLWRRELVQTVTWAGNPTKNREVGPQGIRLTPRESFEEWKETVKGRCKPWSKQTQMLADELRISLLEVILKLTDEAMHERVRAQQQQDLLIAELNHRVRNILNLIRGLINQSRNDATDIDSFSEIIGGRISALASAHDNITKENWTSASLHELIKTEAKAYLSGKLDRIAITGDDAMVTPEAYTVIALVIHELTTNSVKYGALCDSRGSLKITTDLTREGLAIAWREHDGPTVKPPTRQGFGTTIIKQSIPYELKGRVDLRYEPSGVEADILVPPNYVDQSATDTRETRATNHGGDRPDLTDKDNLPDAVLIVEDSMIIALDTEDQLKRIGINTVTVESNVAAALARLKETRYQLALLDYNLGSETSKAIAEELSRREIPFWLATGYGDMGEKVTKLGARGVLTKPYGGEELRGMLREFATAK